MCSSYLQSFKTFCAANPVTKQGNEHVFTGWFFLIFLNEIN